MTTTCDITNSGTLTGSSGSTYPGALAHDGIYLINSTIAGGILNNGSLTGGWAGIQLINSSLSGAIVNASGAHITGGNPGIAVSSSTVSGGITNAGSIIVPNTAIIVGHSVIDNGNIFNSGTITTTLWNAISIGYASISGYISNSGTMTGGNNAVIGIGAATVSGGIINSGQILATAGVGISIDATSTVSGYYGIYNNGGTITGGIRNAGKILGTQDGIRSMGAGSSVSGGIINSVGGTITGGATGWALNINASTLTGGVTNSGLISAGGAGVGFNVSTVSGGISNSGTISATNSGAGDRGIFVLSSTLAGGITNNGTISAGGTSGYAVYIGYTGSTHSSVSGDIKNTGLLSGVFNGLDITNNAQVSGNITNTGTITGTGNVGYALAVYSHSILTGNITNSGTISGNHYGIGVELGSTISGSIINSGTIAAGGTNGAGIYVHASTLSGGVTNSGTISGGAYSINVDNASSVGPINNLANGVLSGNIYVGDATATVSNAGTVWLPETASATIAGNYTQSSTGVFKIDASSSTSYGKLTVGGTASIAGTAYVNVASVNTIASGQTLSGVITAGTLSGNFTSVSTNSNLFGFSSVANGNNLDLCIYSAGSSCGSSNGSNGASVPSTVVTDTKVNGNNPGTGAAVVFDDLIAQGGSAPAAMSSVITALGQMTDSKSVSNAVSQTLPLHTGGESVAITGSLHSVNHIVQSRQEGVQGRSSGDGFVENGRAWVKPFGSLANQGDYNGVSGFKASTGGAVIGADGEVNSSDRLGLAVAIANTDVSGNSSVAPQWSNVMTYQLAIYGSHSLDENTDINYQVDVGDHINKGTRSITFMGSTANSSYRSLSEQLGLGIAHSLKLSDATNFTPSLRADYTTVHNNAYSESGAGALDLNVDQSIVNELIISADGKFTHKLEENSILTANLGVGFNTLNKQNSITSAFAGDPTASFTTLGLNSSPWIGRAGLGYVRTEKTTEVTLRYDVDASSSHFVDQTVSAKFRWSF